MTVQELIEQLQKIEDKSKIFLVEDSDGNLWEIEPDSIYDGLYNDDGECIFRADFVGRR